MKNNAALTILRVSLGAVFLIFGTGKFQNDIWAQTIRSMEVFQRLPWDVNLTVILIGISEVIVGGLLIVGLWTRLAGAVAALQLVTILVLLQFQEIRDIGLLGAAVYIALVKDDSFGVHRLWPGGKDRR